MAQMRELSGRVIAFDRSRGRGIVDIDGRALVVDASVVDASHLLPGDTVSVQIASTDRVLAVRVVTAAREALVTSTRGLFSALLDAQPHAPAGLVDALVQRDGIAEHVRAWLERWDRPIRFWEPDNVAAVVDRRRSDEALTRVLEAVFDPGEPSDRQEWVQARLRTRMC